LCLLHHAIALLIFKPVEISYLKKNFLNYPSIRYRDACLSSLYAYNRLNIGKNRHPFISIALISVGILHRFELSDEESLLADMSGK